VELVTVRTDSPHLEHLPPAVHRVPIGSRHTLPAALGLAAYLRRRRPSVLLAAKDRAGRAAVIARRLAGVDIPLVMRLGTNLSAAMSAKTPLQRWTRYAPIRLLYSRIDRIVAVSDGVAADTVSVSGYPRERIVVIRNPVITPDLRTRAAAPCPHRWLSALERQRTPVIVAAGRLERQKDFTTLLRAFAMLRRHRPCRLILLGDGSWRPRLESLIDDLGIGSAVELPGHQQNPYPFLANADLFALSSIWEGSPNVLTEAMALGTPVVATDCPSGPRETLDGGRFGPLVAVGDAEGLAAAMARTLSDPLSPETLMSAVRDYDYKISAGHYLRLLDSLATGKSHSQGQQVR
jgi:glycosyltransferase involved in cell wall biosynthesis